MGTNATTWFYHEPETGRPYLIAERVNQTLWMNRISNLSVTCTRAEPPYRLEGMWGNVKVEFEYEVGNYFILRTSEESLPFIKGMKEVLGFPPTVSYRDADGWSVTEWYARGGDKRLQEVQGNPAFQSVKRYK